MLRWSFVISSLAFCEGERGERGQEWETLIPPPLTFFILYIYIYIFALQFSPCKFQSCKILEWIVLGSIFWDYILWKGCAGSVVAFLDTFTGSVNKTMDEVRKGVRVEFIMKEYVICVWDGLWEAMGLSKTRSGDSSRSVKQWYQGLPSWTPESGSKIEGDGAMKTTGVTVT